MANSSQQIKHPLGRIGVLALLTTAIFALASTAAYAQRYLYIQGAGYGHGIGMSQYGAYGFAKHKKDYKFILAHYYTGTELDTISKSKTVRVLLQSNTTASFSGATKAGDQKLDADSTYKVSRKGSKEVVLSSAGGKKIATVKAPLKVSGDGTLKLNGKAGNGVTNGRYRGSFEFRPGTISGINAVNALSMESYLRGVVPGEMPALWAQEALKAQSVAARTYALVSSVKGNGFDLYPDTRSQMYLGVSGEEDGSDDAIKATAGEIVTYNGDPITAYFFSTSGGQTENIEDAWPSADPEPYLKSVDDPYDDLSPKHRWGPLKFTLPQATALLGSNVKGKLKKIKVIKRGQSPRIVYADVIGTGGKTRVTGPELRTIFGLNDTWAYFKVSSKPPKALALGKTAF